MFVNHLLFPHRNERPQRMIHCPVEERKRPASGTRPLGAVPDSGLACKMGILRPERRVMFPSDRIDHGIGESQLLFDPHRGSLHRQVGIQIDDHPALHGRGDRECVVLATLP